MKRSDIKYGVFAGMCVLLTFPILGYVQKQSDAMPKPPREDRTSRQTDGQWWQRHALHDWLLHNTDASDVRISDADRRVMEVVIRPGIATGQLISQARRVRQVMAIYFRDGSAGPVTAVVLRGGPGQNVVSVRTGLEDTPPQRDTSWHIVMDSKIID